ncbi:MAG: AAA family ATPase [Magnetococcus sp. DMHC-8]
MIIQALKAENLFKYKHISLSGLADARRILLSGPNESGKTAIVEAICLGLFGRTTALEATQLAKAVRWGEKQGSVAVTFAGSDGQSYTVSRYLEGNGRSQASLGRAEGGKPLAKGVAEVDRAMMGLIGFGYQHYVETLFLTQTSRDESARDTAIQALAGVADLDGLARELRDEELAIQEELAQGDATMQDLQAQLAVLDLQEEALGVLEGQRQTAVDRVAAIGQDLERWQQFAVGLQQAADAVETVASRLLQCDMDTGLDTWQNRSRAVGQALQGLDAVCQAHQVEMDAVPGEGLRSGLHTLQQRLAQVAALMEQVAAHRYSLAVWVGLIPGREETDTLRAARTRLHEEIEHALERRRRFGLLTTFSLVLTLLFGAVGGVLHFQAESALAQALTALLQGLYAGWQPELVPGLLGVAAVSLLLALLGAGQSLGLRGQVADQDQALEELDAHAEAVREMIREMDAAAAQSLPRQVAMLLPLTGGDWHPGLAEWAADAGRALLEEGAQRRLLAQLQGELDGLRREVAEDEAAIVAQRLAGQQALEETEAHSVQLDGQLEQERARREQDRSLRARQADLAVARQDHLHQMAVRQVAQELLKGTCQGLSLRFNQELRRFIAQAAPLFTQGRYQHLRIDDNLQVAAFSAAKNDFVDFNEISTGVRYQLLLAVRMALAQALAARVGPAPQCIVLDEPFVFFDRQRVRESLEALPRVSSQITQVWVIAQEYEDGICTAGDLAVRCTVDADSLVIQGLQN